ncbi:MAG: hypothetical protein KF897_03190 [Opitutaceae bacterium]|nr:hypothetical protein [Opitutaceae bacterium]
MAKQEISDPCAPMSAEAVRAFVRQNDDFAFEMQVAAEIKDILRVEVRHGASYVDPVTLKPRQFDVRFRVEEDCKAVYYAVECKNVAPAYPVIVCGRKADANENFHDVIVSRGQLGTLHASVKRAGATYFCAGEFVGKSILKPGKGRDGEIYEGWSQALASAHELVEEAVMIGAPLDKTSFGAVFPWLVVPNGALWCVDFDRSGHMNEPKLATYCRYFVGHRVSNLLHVSEPICLSHVEIMTIGGMRELLGQLRNIRYDWDDWIPQKIRSAFVGGA